MIVYGDPKWQADAATFLDRIRQRLSTSQRPSLEDLRHILIAAGELEQGVADAREIASQAPDTLIKGQELTNILARAFCSVYRNAPSGAEDFGAALRAIDQITFTKPLSITIKVPEGFAFYALYPEQYIESAQEWASVHAAYKPGSVLVVGIRSIGTTLSAVVAATLESIGWHARRITVRPTGHPFARTAVIAPGELGGAEFAVVVDEGPGASGSSMAAVAEALVSAGLRAEQIAFLPGHDGSPGNAASEKIKQWWEMTPCFTSSLCAVRWRGKSIRDALLRKSSALLGEPCEAFGDLSGGLWRKFLYCREADWPAVSPTFERIKYLCRSRSGRGVLWKFAGLGPAMGGGRCFAERFFEEMQSRGNAAGLKPIEVFGGFVALPWIDGVPLRASDVDAEIIDIAARYIASNAGRCLSANEFSSAVERLMGVVEHNTGEMFAKSDVVRVASFHTETVSGIADGHMAPHEWLRLPDGKIVKTDTSGHDCDHTVIERQPLLWDVAGFIVEWDLNESRRSEFLEHLERNGLLIERHALQFFELAYAAFRMGQTYFCGCVSASDQPERERLMRAAEFYKEKVRRTLRALN